MCDDNCGKRHLQGSRVCYIAGPTGPTGPTGLTGPTGPTGLTGPTGPTDLLAWQIVPLVENMTTLKAQLP